MKVLIDTCVVIDFLQKREPFANAAWRLFRTIATEQLAGYITAKETTDIYYLMHRFTHSDQESRHLLNQLLSLISILDTSSEDIFHALSSDISDFEDAVMTETAIRSKMDCIITRNKKDYAKAGIPIYDPIEFWNLLKNDDVNDIY